MATFAIGDVHGCIDAMNELLAQAKPQRGRDKVIFVGDLVGRGPASAEVVRAVAALGDLAEVVLGNHDLHLLWCHVNSQETQGAMADVLTAPDADELCSWLRARPLAWSVPDVNALVVHAGVWWNWDVKQTLRMAAEVQTAFTGPEYQQALVTMYGDDQMRWDESLIDGLRLQAQVNLFTRMRACWPDGSMAPSYRGLPAEAMPTGCVPWFDMRARRTLTTFIVCGHWSSLGLLLRPDVAMIDCGCCFGGPLAGLWVEDRRLVFAR